MRRAWVAGAGEAAAVTELMVAFRDHLGSASPSAQDARASVDRLLADPDAEFLLAAGADGRPPAAVLQLRFRHSFWTSTPDAWVEDLFVRAEARRSGLGDARVRLASTGPANAVPRASSSTASRTTPPRWRSTSATGSTPSARATPARCC